MNPLGRSLSTFLGALAVAIGLSATAAAYTASDYVVESAGPIIVDTMTLPSSATGAGASIVLRSKVSIVIPEGVTLRAGDGADGLDLRGVGIVTAEDGWPGGDIILDAPAIVLHGRVIAGDGGSGGTAIAHGMHAFARGGHGARGGQVMGSSSPLAVGGAGGAGGDAIAIGATADCGRAGSSADDRGEAGRLAGEGGTEANATATDATAACNPGEDGPPGGDAFAVGGDGNGTGVTPGRPGAAFAFGGRGGDALTACDAGVPAGNGGNGGNATAFGGNITGGPYVIGDGVAAGDAFAQSGGGGRGGDGPVPGTGGPRGSAKAQGGGVYALAIEDGAAGGKGVGVGGDEGADGDSCITPVGGRQVPLQISAGLVGILFAVQLRRHKRV